MGAYLIPREELDLINECKTIAGNIEQAERFGLPEMVVDILKANLSKIDNMPEYRLQEHVIAEKFSLWKIKYGVMK